MSPYDLFAFDVDGTLADPVGDIRAPTIEAIAGVRDAGALVVIATGRPRLLSEPIATEIGGADYIVANNGSLLIDVASGDVLRNVFLDDGVAHRLIGELRAALPGIGLGLEFEHGAKSEEGWKRRLPPGTPLGRPSPDVLELLSQDRGPVRKMVAFHDDFDDDLPGLAREIVPIVGDDALVGLTGLPYLEIGHTGQNKAVALQQLCSSIGVSQTRTVAFGDDLNDLEMLSWAGLGIAMGNAPDRVKGVADQVAPTNENDGVAAVLQDLLSGQRFTG